MSSSKCSFTCIGGIFLPLNPSMTTVYARSAFYPGLRFTLSLQSAFYTQSAVRSPQSAFYTDRISNGVITLGTCSSMFVYICTRFCLTLIGRNLKAQLMEATGELEVNFKFHRCSCKLSFPFPHRCQRNPESLLAGYLPESSFQELKFICEG